MKVLLVGLTLHTEVRKESFEVYRIFLGWQKKGEMIQKGRARP